MVSTTLDLLQWLMRSGTGGPNRVGIGVSKAIFAALEELHTTEKTAENTDQLMVCMHFSLVWSLLSQRQMQMVVMRDIINKNNFFTAVFTKNF